MSRILLAVLLLGASAPAAEAASIIPFADTTGPVVTDGMRYAAWPSGPATVTVRDDAADKTFTLQLPRDCRLRFGGLAVGAGAVWARCDPGADALIDVRTGAVRRLALREKLGTDYNAMAIGRRWLRLYAEASIPTVLANRTTLALRRPRLDRRHALALDAPSGAQVICRGMRAPRQPPLPRKQAPTGFSYDPLLGLVQRPPFAKDTLVLRSCAGGRTRPLSSSLGLGVRTGGGIVSWIETDAHRLGAFRRGRTELYSLDAMPRLALGFGHTRRFLYATAQEAGPPAGAWRIGRARLP